MKWQDDGWRPPEEKEEMLVELREEEPEERLERTVNVPTKVVNMGNGNFVVIDAATMNRAAENARKMGEMILQMGTMLGQIQKRMDEMEARQAQVTASHAEVKRIQALIRCRADEICRKYGLQDKDSPKIFRAAIKKDVLRRYGVKDLHDLPEAALPGAESLVAGWTSIKLVMERRAGA